MVSAFHEVGAGKGEKRYLCFPGVARFDNVDKAALHNSRVFAGSFAWEAAIGGFIHDHCVVAHVVVGGDEPERLLARLNAVVK